MNLRSFRTGLILYCLFDFFIGGYCGGFLPLSPMAAAQFTTVTGTVIDPGGLPYAFGTISATLVTSASPTLNGQPYTPPTQPTGLSSGGSFTMRLADNTVLLPAATQWNFTVCSASGTVQPSIGKGSICFSLAAPITISGATQDITANLHAAALTLSALPPGTINANNGAMGTLAFYPGAGGSAANTISPDPNLIDNGTNVVVAEPFLGPVALATLPTYSFSGRSGNGMWSQVATSVDFSIAAVDQFQISSTANFFRQPVCDFLVGNGCLTLASALLSVTGAGHPNFGFGTDKGQHLVSQAAQADSWGAATCAASTVTVTFTRAYTSTPVIVVSDETTSGGARVSAKSNTAFTITCTGATDVVDYFTGGNPN